jgi:hypothetical protein
MGVLQKHYELAYKQIMLDNGLVREYLTDNTIDLVDKLIVDDLLRSLKHCILYNDDKKLKYFRMKFRLHGYYLSDDIY